MCIQVNPRVRAQVAPGGWRFPLHNRTSATGRSDCYAGKSASGRSTLPALTLIFREATPQVSLKTYKQNMQPPYRSPPKFNHIHTSDATAHFLTCRCARRPLAPTLYAFTQLCRRERQGTHSLTTFILCEKQGESEGHNRVLRVQSDRVESN